MNILDPILNPLLGLDKLWIVVIISLIISLIISVIYKFMTNQTLMKELKAQMKDYQNQMKALRDNPQKMMQVQKKAMEINMKYMGQSMKSTLITFLPIIIIFGWMNANIAYDPIMSDQKFNIEVLTSNTAIGSIELIVPEGIEILDESVKDIQENKATWILKGQKGHYKEDSALKFVYEEREFFKNVLITDQQKYEPVTKNIKDSGIKTIKVGNNEPIILDLGIHGFGWLGSYIIFSILFSTLLRKMMKLH